MTLGDWVAVATFVGSGLALVSYLSSSFRQLRTEFRGELVGLRAESSSLRTEFHGEMVGLRAELSSLRTELKKDIADLHTELKDDLKQFRAEVHSDLADVRGGLRELEHRTYDLARQEAGPGDAGLEARH